MADIVSIEIRPAESDIYLGDTVQYQAIATYDDGTTADITDDITWSVINSSLVAEFDTDTIGLLRSLTSGTGEVLISANVGGFVALSQARLSWMGMAAAPNGDIYACVFNGDIYKQTAGTGDFIALSQARLYWMGMAAAPNGDIYACVFNGDIYKQTAGTGDFIALGQTSRDWTGMAAAPNGDIYACVYEGDIYKQTAGTGDFIALNQTSLAWYGIAAAPNGDIYACVPSYACVFNGDIYKQTAGTGDFIALGQTSRDWTGMAAAPNGDIYACVPSGDIYKQTAGTGDFIALNQTSLAWYGIAAAPNGDIYACVFNGDIYKQTAISVGISIHNPLIVEQDEDLEDEYRSTVDDFQALYTSQYQNSTRLLAWSKSFMDIADSIKVLAQSLPFYFSFFRIVDKDVLVYVPNALTTKEGDYTFTTFEACVGDQLDVLGVVLGVRRRLTFNPTDGSSPVLDDDTYRIVLKNQVLRNHWDGKAASLQETWRSLFPGGKISVQDNQNMTIDVTVSGAFTAIMVDLIQNGYIVPRPQGVLMNYYIGTLSPPNLPFFGFDRDDSYLSGFDEGHWV